MCKDEREYCDEVLKYISNGEIRNRIKYLLNWYTKKANRCKYKYYIFSFIGIIGPALITLISSYESTNYKWMIPVISTISSICAGILVLTQYREGWLRYRKSVEQIKSYTNIYLVEIQELLGGKKTEKDKEFIKLIEKIVLEENIEWFNTRNKEINGENKE